MKNVGVTFVAGAVVLGAVGALVLMKAPPRLVRIGAPGVKAIGPGGAGILGTGTADFTLCQGDEVLPGGVTAIRVSMWAFYGARIHVAVFRGSQLLTQGRRSADWTSDSVTVPVSPVPRTTRGVKICFAVGPTSEPISVLGSETSRSQTAVFSERITPTASLPVGGGRPLGGRDAIEYLAPGSGSWWSRLLPVARRMGLGRAFSGTWIALLVAALMVTVCALAALLTLREVR